MRRSNNYKEMIERENRMIFEHMKNRKSTKPREVPKGFVKGIDLKMENYGFPDDRKVKIAPERLELELSDRAREVYEELLGSEEVFLNDLLEGVGFVVNDSMEHDIDRLVKLKIEDYCRGLDKEKTIKSKEFKEHIKFYEEGFRSKGYIPTGREVIKGVCIDSGALIRRILRSMNLENEFGGLDVGVFSYYSPNSSEEVTYYHDTTTVFSKKTGRWVLINSKSPTKPYNLVPKEKIGVDFTF